METQVLENEALEATSSKYKSDFKVNFEIGSNINSFTIDTSGSFPYDMANSGDMKLSIDKSTVQEVVLRVQTTDTKSKDTVVTWFKEHTNSAPALSREKSTNWPPQMRFALMPAVSLQVNDSGTLYNTTWEGLTLGIDTVGKNTWWLSSKYVKSKHDLSIIGITIEDDVMQENKIKEGVYLRLYVKVDGTHHFKVRAEVGSKSIFP